MRKIKTWCRLTIVLLVSYISVPLELTAYFDSSEEGTPACTEIINQIESENFNADSVFSVTKEQECFLDSTFVTRLHEVLIHLIYANKLEKVDTIQLIIETSTSIKEKSLISFVYWITKANLAARRNDIEAKIQFNETAIKHVPEGDVRLLLNGKMELVKALSVANKYDRVKSILLEMENQIVAYETNPESLSGSERNLLFNFFQEMGFLQKKQRDYVKSISYFKRAASITHLNASYRSVALSNLMNVLYANEDIEEAKSVINEILSIENLKNKKTKVLTYKTLINILLYEDNLVEAATSVSEFEHYMNSNNLTNYSDIFDRTKGNYLLKMKDFTNAKKLFVKSYETNKRLGKFNTQLYSLKRVILSELSKSDTIMPKYFDAYLEMVDTLVDKRLSNNLAEWEVKYQATIKEQEAKLANQKLIIVEANNSKKNAYLLLSFLGMALIGALALLFYRENKRKTQDNQKLQQGIKGLEKLLIDVNHRTKGQFNTTAYFLQTKRRLTTDKNVSVAMMDAENLIHSIITINKYLALDSKSSLQKSTAVIAENMKFGADRLSGKNLKFKLNIPLLKTSDTNNLTVGTIITELITNSIKYAFEAEDKPEIQINMEEHKNGEVSFRYKDNGIGHKIHDITSGKGLAIIDDMVEQLNGSYKTSTVDGFYFESSFPSFIKND